MLDSTGAPRDRSESARTRAKVERERKRTRDIQQPVRQALADFSDEEIVRGEMRCRAVAAAAQ